MKKCPRQSPRALTDLLPPRRTGQRVPSFTQGCWQGCPSPAQRLREQEESIQTAGGARTLPYQQEEGCPAAAGHPPGCLSPCGRPGSDAHCGREWAGGGSTWKAAAGPRVRVGGWRQVGACRASGFCAVPTGLPSISAGWAAWPLAKSFLATVSASSLDQGVGRGEQDPRSLPVCACWETLGSFGPCLSNF